MYIPYNILNLCFIKYLIILRNSYIYSINFKLYFNHRIEGEGAQSIKRSVPLLIGAGQLQINHEK
jgi:hypothetical protein